MLTCDMHIQGKLYLDKVFHVYTCISLAASLWHVQITVGCTQSYLSRAVVCRDGGVSHDGCVLCNLSYIHHSGSLIQSSAKGLHWLLYCAFSCDWIWSGHSMVMVITTHQTMSISVNNHLEPRTTHISLKTTSIASN